MIVVSSKLIRDTNGIHWHKPSIAIAHKMYAKASTADIGLYSWSNAKMKPHRTEDPFVLVSIGTYWLYEHSLIDQAINSVSN